MKYVISLILILNLSLFSADEIDLRCKQNGELAPEWTCMPPIIENYVTSIGVGEDFERAFVNGTCDAVAQHASKTKKAYELDDGYMYIYTFGYIRKISPVTTIGLNTRSFRDGSALSTCKIVTKGLSYNINYKKIRNENGKNVMLNEETLERYNTPKLIDMSATSEDISLIGENKDHAISVYESALHWNAFVASMAKSGIYAVDDFTDSKGLKYVLIAYDEKMAKTKNSDYADGHFESQWNDFADESEFYDLFSKHVENKRMDYIINDELKEFLEKD